MFPTRADVAERFSSPLLKLLILDWRFSCIIVVAIIGIGGCVLLPLRMFRTTAPGIIPVVRINLLELIQARNLTQNALKAEAAGDTETAQACWSRAVASNPGSIPAARGYVNSFASSPNRANWLLAFRAACWLTNIAPHSSYDLTLWTKVADMNSAWALVDATLSARPDMRNDTTKLYWLRSHFFSGRFEAAAQLIARMSDAEKQSAASYIHALKMISGTKPEQEEAMRALQASMTQDRSAIPAYEAFLVAASASKKADVYGPALKSLMALTTNTFAYQVDYVRLLRASGRKGEAVDIASRLPAPETGEELLQTALVLLDLKMLSEALRLLQAECGRFSDLQPSILYATLLLEQENRDDLAKLRSRFNSQRAAPDSSPFILALDAAVRPEPVRFERLVAELVGTNAEPSSVMVDFAQRVLMKGKQPQSACRILLQYPRTNDFVYARELFVAADGARDCNLMRSSAQAWYELSPKDLLAAENYGAMLAMFEEKPDLNLRLANQCLEAAPGAVSVKINHIAALINNGKYKLADAMASSIDAAALSPYELSHFQFLKLKCAVKAGRTEGIAALLETISPVDLYLPQLDWLGKNGLKLRQTAAGKNA